MQSPPTAAATPVDLTQQKNRLKQISHFSAPVHAMLALDAGRMGSWSLDIPTGEVVGDRLVASLLGFQYDAQPWQAEQFYSSVHPDDLAEVQLAVDKALAGETPFYDIVFRTNQADESRPDVWLGARGQVTERDEGGAPLRLAGVNWDATAQKVNEQKLATLAAEMDHRIKNAFAVIRALVKIGVQSSSDKEDFASILSAQVEAMATAHALSARMARTTADADTKLDIREIIETSLAPWLNGPDDMSQRVGIICDKNMQIPPRKVSPLAMILYEISTNAAKHGALAEADGKVNITVDRHLDDAVTLKWTETADIAPRATETTGFGTVLLSHCAQNLGGSITQTKTVTGFETVLTIDLAD